MGNRIVLVGVGSAVFGYNSVLDAVNLPGLMGVNLVLHDIDEGRLNSMAGLAERMNEEAGAGLEIEETTDKGGGPRGRRLCCPMHRHRQDASMEDGLGSTIQVWYQTSYR
jgi:hypothetical protein